MFLLADKIADSQNPFWGWEMYGKYSINSSPPIWMVLIPEIRPIDFLFQSVLSKTQTNRLKDSAQIVYTRTTAHIWLA